MKGMMASRNVDEAAEKILAALGMTEGCEEPDEAEPDAPDAVLPLAGNAGVMVIPTEEETKPTPQPENPETPQGNAVLCALNLAIKAIYALDKCMLGDSVLYYALHNCAEDLETVRNEKFGHLVDWEAIARSVD